MTGPVFVDTNVLIYFHDARFPGKRAHAAAWIKLLWDQGTGRLSRQVLTEFYQVTTQKLDPPLPREVARQRVRLLETWHPVNVDRRLSEWAWTLQDRYSFSWWDALIVAAAKVGDCRYLLTEDLQSGQDIEGLTVVNPFVTAPDSVR